MKNFILAILTTLMYSVSGISFPTIILINGEPYLVELSEDAHIVSVIQPVPYYFSSELTHEEIVADLKNQLKLKKLGAFANTDVNVLDNAEFVEFMPDRALLDKIAVDRIRRIAEDFANGSISHIQLSILYQNTSSSQLLTDNRITSVKDMLVDFGVDGNAISIAKDLKAELSANPYVKIEYSDE